MCIPVCALICVRVCLGIKSVVELKCVGGVGYVQEKEKIKFLFTQVVWPQPSGDEHTSYNNVNPND